MRTLLLFLLVVLAAMVICALIPWQVPRPAPVPAATLTPVKIEPSMQVTAVVTIAAPTSTATAVPPPTSTVPPLPTTTPLPTLPPKPLAVQPGSHSYLPAFMHTEAGCAWIGAAGQVLNAAGEGITNAVVMVSGSVDDQPVDGMALSGTAEVYGPGGYEIDLSQYVSLGGAAALIQVFDLQGEALTDPVSFNLPSVCGQNMVLINFQPSSTTNSIFMPVIQGNP